MCTAHPVPADAYPPDPDRAGRAVSASTPEWVVYFVARLMLFLIRHLAAFRRRQTARMPSWWVTVPEYAPGSAQELAASLRGAFGNLITTMCWLDGIGPGHKDWPYLSRTIVAFGGSVRLLDGRRHPRSWWNRPEIVPGLNGDLPEHPTAASLLAQRLAADALLPVPVSGLATAPYAQAAHGCIAHAMLPALWRQVFARAATGPPVRAGTGPPLYAGTGPPIGPPSDHDDQFCYARRTGPEHGQPRRSDSCHPKILCDADTAHSGH
jgi:hypothetical protein